MAAQAHESPRIHVVMGVYRPREDFLQRQVQSILAQDYPNISLYAVLDGPDPEAERVLGSSC
jgi:cellulose synthase/poly-beta-1,6-N-acetylglucosamine synthase-like glycosyltransferase